MIEEGVLWYDGVFERRLLSVVVHYPKVRDEVETTLRWLSVLPIPSFAGDVHCGWLRQMCPIDAVV
jgi:hypothetical protein